MAGLVLGISREGLSTVEIRQEGKCRNNLDGKFCESKMRSFSYCCFWFLGEIRSKVIKYEKMKKECWVFVERSKIVV